jgi:acyl dehydratase
VLVATRAVLLELKTVRVVAPVLLGDVVPLFALHAGQRDLRADVCSGHGSDSYFDKTDRK